MTGRLPKRSQPGAAPAGGCQPCPHRWRRLRLRPPHATYEVRPDCRDRVAMPAGHPPTASWALRAARPTARVGPGMDRTSSTRTSCRQPTPTGVDPSPAGWRQSRPPERSWPPTASGRRHVSSRLERAGDRRGQPHSVGRLRQQLRSRIRLPLFVRSPADLPRFTGSVR